MTHLQNNGQLHVDVVLCKSGFYSVTISNQAYKGFIFQFYCESVSRFKSMRQLLDVLIRASGFCVQIWFFSALISIFHDGDFYVLDTNSFDYVSFVHLECESVAEQQSVVIASGPHEACIMRCVARPPALIQLESDDVLTGVERIAGFW